MGSNWKRYPFEDCMDAIIDYRGKTPKKTTSGIPLITAKIIKNGAIQPVTEFIAEDDYDSWMRRGIPMQGDVVLTTEAPLGEVAQLDERKIALAQRVITLRGKANFLDNTFLKYLLISNDVQHQLDGRGTGTTVKGIKQSELRKVELPIPEFNTQLSIAKILVDLDNKIYLNQQTNQTLEQMAQTLFKSWFVDFDPVFDNLLAKVDFDLTKLPNDFPDVLLNRAQKRLLALNANESSDAGKINKADQQAEKQAQSANIHQHFPSEFEHNEQLGWIPKGWQEKTIDELCRINPQSWTKKTAPDFVNYVDLANAKNGTVGEAIEYSFSDAPSRARRVLQPHDTIIGVVRPANRSFAYVNEEGLTGSTGFAVVRANNQNCRAFAYFSLTNDDCIQEFTRIADGAAYPAIKPEDVAKANFIYSNEHILENFERIAGELMRKVAANEQQIKPLTKLRDTLLPKLISGEIEIRSEAESIL